MKYSIRADAVNHFLDQIVDRSVDKFSYGWGCVPFEAFGYEQGDRHATSHKCRSRSWSKITSATVPDRVEQSVSSMWV